MLCWFTIYIFCLITIVHKFFDVLLTVHLSIFISVINQQKFCASSWLITEIKNIVHNLYYWYYCHCNYYLCSAFLLYKCTRRYIMGKSCQLLFLVDYDESWFRRLLPWSRDLVRKLKSHCFFIYMCMHAHTFYVSVQCKGCLSSRQ